MKRSAEQENRVLVIGAAGLDVVGRLETELHTGTSNPARIRTSHGGVARNVAENLARLGQPVSLVTVVGSDHNGQSILTHATRAGVDVSAALTTSEYPTGFYMGVLNNKGQLELAVDDMRLISLLTPAYLKERIHLFENAAQIFFDANLPEDTIEFLVHTAVHKGIPLCADPASPTLTLRLLPHLPRLYMVTPNAREAGILTGQSFGASDRRAALKAVRHLATLGVDVALVTMAEFGVCYATSETNGHVPAIRTQISDPTGAGDAMTAAVMFALLNDIDLDDAVRLGAAAASLTLRTPGTVCEEMTLEKLYDELPG